MKLRRLLSTAALLTLTVATHAQPAYQDAAALKRTVEQFLQVQSGGLPGQVTVAVGAIDPRMNLAACPDPQAFFMPGARAWGKTTVGVRCATPAAWTVYIKPASPCWASTSPAPRRWPRASPSRPASW